MNLVGLTSSPSEARIGIVPPHADNEHGDARVTPRSGAVYPRWSNPSMETRTIRLGNCKLFLSRPFEDRPEVILVVTDDGRRAILGDGPEPFMAHREPPRELVSEAL